MNPKDLEERINGTLGNLKACLIKKELGSASYWLEEFQKDMKNHGQILQKQLLYDYAIEYVALKQRIENVYLGL